MGRKSKKKALFLKKVVKKFGRLLFLLYLCTAKQENGSVAERLTKIYQETEAQTENPSANLRNSISPD